MHISVVARGILLAKKGREYSARTQYNEQNQLEGTFEGGVA